MTFELKNLAKLTEDWNNVLQVIYANEKKGKIEDTSPTRQPILHFLNTIINHLSTKVKDPWTSKNGSDEFYGALYIAIRHINNTRKGTKSVLRDALEGIIQDADYPENKPVSNQRIEFYRKINLLLTQVFNDSDSSKGISPVHPFKIIPTEDLCSFMTLGLELERDIEKEYITLVASKACIDQVAKPNLLVTKFKDIKIPGSAISDFVSWERFQSSTQSIIIKDIGLKGEGNLTAFVNNNPCRGKQLQFIEKIRESLLNTKLLTDDKKTAILAGSMYLVHRQIDTEHSFYSYIHEEFGKLLDVKLASHESKQVLFFAAWQYIKFMSTVNTEKEQGHRTNHIFSSIKEFNLTESLNLIQDMIFFHKNESLKKAFDEFSMDNKTVVTTTTATPSLFQSTLNFFAQQSMPAENSNTAKENISEPPLETISLKNLLIK